jgi:uncharacterized protein
MKMTLPIILSIIVIGIAAGMLGGMVGVGGGIIIVPALVYLLGFSQKMAQGTSLGLIMLPVGILGVLSYYKQGYVDFKVVGLLAVGFVAGSLIGSKIALKMPEMTIKRIFAVLLIIVAIKMLFFDKEKNDTGAKKSNTITNTNDRIG